MQIWGPYERRFAFRGAPGGAKDGGDGFFGLWPQNDGIGRRCHGAPGRRAPHKKRFRIGAAGGRRPPLRMRRKDGVGAAFGRPARHRVSLCHSERSEESVSPVLYTTRAQRSGSCCERTSKGAERVFAVRRKQSEADFARTKRSEESVFPVFVRDRKGMGREIRILRPYGLRMTGMGRGSSLCGA